MLTNLIIGFLSVFMGLARVATSAVFGVLDRAELRTRMAAEWWGRIEWLVGVDITAAIRAVMVFWFGIMIALFVIWLLFAIGTLIMRALEVIGVLKP